MTLPVSVEFLAFDQTIVAQAAGRVVIFAMPDAPLDAGARVVDKLSRGAVKRLVASAAFGALEQGAGLDLAFPTGMAAEAVQVIKLGRKPRVDETRAAGATIAKAAGTAAVLVLGPRLAQPAELAFGLTLRAYAFSDHKTGAKKPFGAMRVMVTDHDAVAAQFAPLSAVAEGVFVTRDLVSEPANVLTTSEFAARLEEMRTLGIEVEVLDEDALHALGMGALLGVGQGSESPSKVVVMQWRHGAPDAAPLALIGKGVVFDTGGISIKPAGGMEDMTMDMGGAAVVSGVMRALALRNAPANVVGLVGLVENMPDGRAQRPGDIVRSMKGDTIEVINTDAEGRLVLADVMWYAQDRFAPAAMIDLATLTGAIIVALAHENAGVFSNNDALCKDFLAAAAAENEGAWRMPLGKAYDDMLKSNNADMKNVGGREGGSITAAQFLQRFVKPETPWIHLDIAGTALTKSETALAPKGATGWGVRALNRLIRDRFES